MLDLAILNIKYLPCTRNLKFHERSIYLEKWLLSSTCNREVSVVNINPVIHVKDPLVKTL